MDSDRDSYDHFNGRKALFQPTETQSPSDSPAPKKAKQKCYRKKVETSWSHENILKLIREVESRRSLWDVRCAEYKLHKDNIWQEVADAIPTSFNDCKGKWTNLRTTFKCNLEKFRRQKSGTDKIISITWKYFRPMMFLETNKLRQSTQSTSSMKLECATTDESVLNDSELSDELSLPSLPRQQRNRKSTIPKSLSSKINRGNNELEEMAVEPLQSIRSRALQQKDPSTAFAEYIAAELRNLTPEQAACARAKLRRAFNDIMDEVSLMVPQQKEFVLFTPKQD